MQRRGIESIRYTSVSGCMFFHASVTAEVRVETESYCCVLWYTSLDIIAHTFSMGFSLENDLASPKCPRLA